MSSVTKSVFEDSKTPKEQGTNNQKKKNGENTVKGGKAVLKEAISVVDDYVANCGYQLLHAAHKNLSKQAPDPKEYQKFLQNRERNRSERIPCLDKTRFVLEPKENEKDSSDYIHASRIVIEGVDKEFIITQAPLRNTLEDFWRMVFQVGPKSWPFEMDGRSSK